MARVKISRAPEKKAKGGEAKRSSSAPPTSQMFQNTLMYPNLVFNAPTIGLMNSNTVGTNDQKITDSVNPIDEKLANIVAEKGELVVKPGLAGMYRINGKKHKQGGTALNVEEGAFIFSDNKSLAFNPEEKKLFNFKDGGRYKEKNNTPAKVLAREVKPKDYNRLISILNSKDTDHIAKNSASLMLQKHQEIAGRVALLQEVKKNFKNGVPDFATAPPSVNSEDADEIADKQYAKLGGYTYDTGGDTWPIFTPPLDPHKGDRRKTKDPTTGIISNSWNGSRRSKDEWNAFAKTIGYNGSMDDNTAFQGYVLKNYPEIVNYRHSSKSYGMPSVTNKILDGKIGVRWDAIADDIQKLAPDPKIDIYHPDQNPPPPVENPGLPGLQKRNSPDIPQGVPGKQTVGSQPWEGFNFKPNSAEMLSIAAPGLQALATPTYYDMLSQKYTPNMRLDRLNNRQETSDINSQANLGTQEAFSNLPANIAASLSASMRANAMKNIAGSNANINQANTQIANQEAMTNFGAKRDDNNFNTANVHQTYNNNILSLQRRNEMRNNAASQVINNGMAVQRNLNDMSYAATAAALPYVTNMKDANGNVQIFTDDKGNQFTKQGVPINFNSRRMPTFDPNFGGLDSFGINQYANQGSSGQMAELAEKNYITALQSGDSKAIYAASKALEAYRSTKSGTSAAQGLAAILSKFQSNNP